jgi:hypothetical protein
MDDPDSGMDDPSLGLGLDHAIRRRLADEGSTLSLHASPHDFVRVGRDGSRHLRYGGAEEDRRAG